eukprot:625349-Prorocentrum_minimum.AAC.1
MGRGWAGRRRCYMALYGVAWRYMVLHGVTWCYMALHGVAWCYMALHGPRHGVTSYMGHDVVLQVTWWCCVVLHGVTWCCFGGRRAGGAALFPAGGHGSRPRGNGRQRRCCHRRQRARQGVRGAVRPPQGGTGGHGPRPCGRRRRRQRARQGVRGAVRPPQGGGGR